MTDKPQPTSEMVHEVLSTFSNEAHAAIIFILADKYNVRVDGPAPSTMVEIVVALRKVFGESADLIIYKMNELAMKEIKQRSPCTLFDVD